MKEDSRREDNELLSEHGLSAGHFGEIWEEELHEIKHSDRNQERWHLSRMSLLAGYLLGQGKEMSEVLEIIGEHRSQGENQ